MGHYAGEMGYSNAPYIEHKREDGKCYNCDGRGWIGVPPPYPSLARDRRALCFDCRGSGEARADG